MHSRKRYQHGCLTKKKRARGEHVWEFRYYETTTEGQRRRRSEIVGSVAQRALANGCQQETFHTMLTRRHILMR